MEKTLLTIKKRIDKEETIYEELERKLHSNPIKNRLNQFMTTKLKSSVIDILKSI